MTSELIWQEEYNIGVDIIDKEHQRLFQIINRILAFKDEEKNGRWACREGIKFFKTHAVKHFKDEEAYMESIGYTGLAQHRRIHNGFRENTLPALEKELESTDYSPDTVSHFLGVCAGWLVGHTLTEDLSIAGKRARKWEHCLPGEEVSIIKQVIAEMVFDMFHLESQMISDSYGGEEFGKGVYYRLVYGEKGDEKKQEILLAFEEKLLVNTVGKVLGLKTNKLDSMLVHASRYTAQQFAGRVIESFPNMEGYERKEENLLSYEQFQKIFEREKFQASLLFNTGGAGYFAYCMIAPHLLEEGIGTPIEKENAISEVEKYLAKREKQEQQKETDTRKKILVVDDSQTLRQSIKLLLDKDYNVSMAPSGAAAIRTITLSRPDLVLLDYEMPVCDGRQTLEMLRAEAEFQDLPVIFLTGRGDPDSMTKVMSLDPSGYLLKNSKPEQIKQEIDAFFAKKKKILVVDDSQTMRMSIKQLLDKDYNVSMAPSGATAIRTITLNRPDLVLLDYEMPVCDGRQTLEMLRAEEEFQDLPVIFLTGRRDPDSMIKVMPLNPSGYLLKNSKPEQIKKEIDAFFAKKK